MNTSNHPLNNLYRQLKHRILSPKSRLYPRYGGRGIRLHDSWLNFETFVADVGPRPSPAHSLDRIDNTGHYEPGNVRWATAAEQARNRRSNVFLTLDGRTMCVSDWAEELGVPTGLLFGRKKCGWSDQEILTIPSGQRRRICS